MVITAYEEAEKQNMTTKIAAGGGLIQLSIYHLLISQSPR
jgi:hypothetical protein